MSTLTQLTEQHPETARAILQLITHPTDRQKLRDLLGSCTCSNDSLICTSCPVIYTPPKGTDYSGHTPGGE